MFCGCGGGGIEEISLPKKVRARVEHHADEDYNTSVCVCSIYTKENKSKENLVQI